MILMISQQISSRQAQGTVTQLTVIETIKYSQHPSIGSTQLDTVSCRRNFYVSQLNSFANWWLESVWRRILQYII